MSSLLWNGCPACRGIRNLGKIVLGRRSVGWQAYRFPWQRRFSTRLGAIAPDIDLILVELGSEVREDTTQAHQAPFETPLGTTSGKIGWRQYGLAPIGEKEMSAVVNDINKTIRDTASGFFLGKIPHSPARIANTIAVTDYNLKLSGNQFEIK